MQVILLEKVANLGNLGDVVKVKDGFARNFLIPTQARAPRHRSGDQGIRSQARRTREGRRRQAGRGAGAGEKLAGKTVTHHAEGRRRRPPVRLGHQLPTSPRAEEAGLRRAEVAGAHAQRPAEDRRRPAVSVAPHTDVVVDITVTVVGEVD